MDRMKLWWDSYHFQGSSSFIVASKFKALKVDLRNGNSHVHLISLKKREH